MQTVMEEFLEYQKPYVAVTHNIYIVQYSDDVIIGTLLLNKK